jgi:hypothetical protein
VLAAGVLASPATTPAQRPAGTRWTFASSTLRDFEIAVDSTVAHTGRTSLRVHADDDPVAAASVQATIPAADFAGTRVRVSALLRTAALQGFGASVSIRADSAPTGTAAFASSQMRPYVGGTMSWTPLTVELDVPATARTLVVVVRSAGRGTLWADDVRVERLAPGAKHALVLGFEAPDTLVAPVAPRGAALARSPREPARPLSLRGLDNVVAFARLVGYVRFFHPSDAAFATDWDEFTVRGMRVVERAPTADSLVATLRALFATVAPTVAIHRTGTTPAAVPTVVGATGVVVWRHFGYGVPAGTPSARSMEQFKSVRRRVPLVDGRVPGPSTPPAAWEEDGPIPDPGRPFVADLGGGVSVAVPLSLLTTAPAVDSLWRVPPATERLSTSDRATRLASVALLWMVPQHFYSYFDAVKVDWSAALRRSLSAAATDSSGPAFDATLERLLAALRDGHGYVRRSVPINAMPDVRLGWVEGRVVVTAVGDSAAAARVSRGDEVVAVDGRPIGDALRDAMARASGSTEDRVRLRALENHLTAGPLGTMAVLRLRDPLSPATPVREVRLRRLVTLLPVERPAKTAEPLPGIVYLNPGQLSDDELDAMLPRLVAARGIVVDVRDHPHPLFSDGHLLPLLSDSPIRSGGASVPYVTGPDGRMTFRGGVGSESPPRQPRLRARVVFLSGPGAISAGESMLSKVEANRLGPIVGAPTPGTTGNVHTFALPAGYLVTWTGYRVRQVDGSHFHGVGVRPTVPVAPTLRGLRQGRDEVLERALELVDGR